MNIIMHIFKKDIRRLRLLTGLWILLLMAQLALLVSTFDATSGSMAWEGLFSVLGVLIPRLQMLVAFVLVPMIIQGEPLVGTTAYWLTRPIAARQLLVAKAISCLGLLVVLPAIAEIVVLAANHATIGQIGLALPEILMDRTLPLMVSAALAAITPTITGFVMYGVVLYVIYLLGKYALPVLGLFMDPMVLASRYIDSTLNVSRIIVAALVVIIGCGAAVVHQYLRRVRAVSAMMFAASLLVFVAVPYLWSWDFMQMNHVTGRYDARGASFSLEDERLRVMDEFLQNPGLENRPKRLQGRLMVDGVMSGYELRPLVKEGTFTFEDGFQATLPKHPLNFGVYWNIDSVQQVLGEYRLVNGVMPSFSMADLFSLPDKEYNDRKAQTGRLDLKLDVDAYRYEVIGTTPLAPGGTIHLGAEQAAIMDVLRDEAGVTVIMRERFLQLRFDRSAYAPGNFNRGTRNVLYVLKHSGRGEFLMPNIDYASGFGGMTGLKSSNRLQAKSQRVSFAFNRFGANGDSIDEAWLAEAELVRIDAVKIDQFEGKIAMDGLPLQSSSSRITYSSVARPAAPKQKTREEIAVELARITLPDNASETETREYVRAIANASKGQRSTSNNDRQIVMLQEIDPRYLYMMFEELPANSIYLPFAAMPLVGEANKAWVIEHLNDYPWLVETVWKKNWMVDARDQLLSGLGVEDKQQASYGHWMSRSWNQPDPWLLCVASLNDPATRDALVDHFVHRGKRLQNYRVIRELDWIDLDDVMEQTWAVVKNGDLQEMLRIVPLAIAHGQVDALRAGILDVLNGPYKKEYQVKSIRNAVWRYTGRDERDEALADWFSMHADSLRFDRDARLFRSGDDVTAIDAKQSGQAAAPLVSREPLIDRLQALTSRNGHHKQGKSKSEVNAALDRISLPLNPSVEEIRMYIQAIIRASTGQTSWGSNDRQVAMLRAVGPEHVRLLFEEYTEAQLLYGSIVPGHLQYAASTLISEQDKNWVIRRLLQYPWLSEQVWNNGWAPDARDELLTGIQEMTHVPEYWYLAVASLKEPSTYHHITDYFVAHGSARMYESIRELEGIDLDSVVAKAWRSATYNDTYAVKRMVPVAIAYGHMDALRTGIIEILKTEHSCAKCKGGPVMRAVEKHTGIKGDADAIIAWFKENETKLVYDVQTQMYDVQ